MEGPTYTKLEPRDVDLCRAFLSVVKQGKFEIKGDAVSQVGMLFKWFNDLDKRIEETIRSSTKTVRKSLDGKL
jgi:hypothetical protein